MAVTTFQHLHTNEVRDLDLDATVEAVDAASGNLFAGEFDNSANTSDSFVKLYNVASGSVNLSTPTEPDIVVRVKAGSKRVMFFNHAAGYAYDTALSAACVTQGGSAGTTAPTNSVKANFYTD